MYLYGNKEGFILQAYDLYYIVQRRYKKPGQVRPYALKTSVFPGNMGFWQGVGWEWWVKSVNSFKGIPK